MKRIAPLAFLLLAACGFQPIYSSHDHSAPVADEMAQVAIDNIPDRTGQMLRNNLIDRMYGTSGRPRRPLYHLGVELRTTIEDLGIQADATSTRTLLNTYGTYALTDRDGNELIRGTAHSVASYNKLSDQYGSLASKENAIDRTINEVSEQITNRVSLYFAERAEPRTK